MAVPAPDCLRCRHRLRQMPDGSARLHRWKQQRETMLAKIRDTTKASDDEISRNLVGLARSRPDVFGELRQATDVEFDWHLASATA